VTGKGGFDLPGRVLTTQTISSIDYNYYAGFDPSIWHLQCGGSHNVAGGSFPCFDPVHYDLHGVLNATATVDDAVALFHRPKTKAHHELSVEDYTVRGDSIPATQLGFVPWNT
jgi:hypothetical protein